MDGEEVFQVAPNSVEEPVVRVVEEDPPERLLDVSVRRSTAIAERIDVALHECFVGVGDRRRDLGRLADAGLTELNEP